MTDYRLIPKIPRQPEDSRFKIEPLLPFKRTSPRWYLAWPQIIVGVGYPSSPGVHVYYCYAGPNRHVETIGLKTYIVDYCGAPPGVRCSCGTQTQGHDPGDEQP